MTPKFLLVKVFYFFTIFIRSISFQDGKSGNTQRAKNMSTQKNMHMGDWGYSSEVENTLCSNSQHHRKTKTKTKQTKKLAQRCYCFSHNCQNLQAIKMSFSR